MANSLTGEFDLVAQVSLPAVNRILAVQHQRQTYLHSFRASLPPFDDSADNGISPLVSSIRGFVDVQVSTPGISFPTGTGNGGSRVSVHYQAMVRYTSTSVIPASLREFIHGEIITTLNIEQINSQGEDLINVDLSNNVDVTFIPADDSNLSPDDVSLIEQVISNFLKKGFQPVNVIVRLPSNGDFRIHFWRFKFMWVQGESAIAILANLQNVAPSPGSPASVNTIFLEGQDDFAIAISSEFIIETLTNLITDTLKPLDGKEFRPCISVPLAPDPCPTYKLKINPSKFTLGNDLITFTITGDLTSPNWYAPDFSFKIELDFGLQVRNNQLVLTSIGDVRVDLSTSSWNPLGRLILQAVQDEVEKEVRMARDRILDETRDQIGNMLSGFSNILGQLRISNAHLTFTGVDIRNSGVISHGKLGLEAPNRVRIAFNAATRRRAGAEPPVDEFVLNAFHSWIPGGTIQQYQWSGLVNRTENHRFITQFAGQISRQPKVTCLTMSGTQGSFFSTSQASGQACSIISPLMLNPFFTRLDVGNNRLPAPVITRLAPGNLAAHIDLRLLREGSPAPAPNGFGNNLVVHFTGSQTESLAIVRDALNENDDKSRTTFVAAVVPEGGLENSLPQVSSTNITLAEDPENRWEQTFTVNQTPATFIIDPRGNIAWQQVGPLNLATLSAALGQHIDEKGEPVRWQQLRLAVKEGDLFPDFVFRRPDGASIPLRRLFGPPLLINFWTTWSEPCLEVLRQLQIIENQPTSSRLLILTINDGEDPQLAEGFFRRNNLSLNLVPDPDRRISRVCGVNCWPTTVILDETGRVQHIYFGLSQQSNRPPFF